MLDFSFVVLENLMTFTAFLDGLYFGVKGLFSRDFGIAGEYCHDGVVGVPHLSGLFSGRSSGRVFIADLHRRLTFGVSPYRCRFRVSSSHLGDISSLNYKGDYGRSLLKAALVILSS